MLAQTGATVDALALVACLALAAATFVYVFLIQPDPADSAPHRTKLDQLLERRDVIYDNLRDLKFEYRAGKFADQDYEQMKQELETEAAVVLAEIDTVTENPLPAARRMPTARRSGSAAAEPGA